MMTPVAAAAEAAARAYVPRMEVLMTPSVHGLNQVSADELHPRCQVRQSID